MDDFTRIKGIGPATAQRLHESGIHTFSELAAHSPSEIACQARGLSAKRILREGWVQQARRLAARRKFSDQGKNGTLTPGAESYALFTINLLLNDDRSVKGTRITHVQSGIIGKWGGWDLTQLTDFLVANGQLNLLSSKSRPKLTRSRTQSSPRNSGSIHVPISPLDPHSIPETTLAPQSYSPSEPASTAPAALPRSGKDLDNSLSGVLQVCEMTILRPDSTGPQYSLMAGEIFHIQVVSDLTNVKHSAEARLSYEVAIWAKKIGVKSRQLVGEEAGIFVPADKLPCIVTVVIHSQGIYRLEALVTLAEEGKESLTQYSLMAMQTGGLLQVL